MKTKSYSHNHLRRSDSRFAISVKSCEYILHLKDSISNFSNVFHSCASFEYLSNCSLIFDKSENLVPSLPFSKEKENMENQPFPGISRREIDGYLDFCFPFLPRERKKEKERERLRVEEASSREILPLNGQNSPEDEKSSPRGRDGFELMRKCSSRGKGRLSSGAFV